MKRLISQIGCNIYRSPYFFNTWMDLFSIFKIEHFEWKRSKRSITVCLLLQSAEPSLSGRNPGSQSQISEELHTIFFPLQSVSSVHATKE